MTTPPGLKHTHTHVGFPFSMGTFYRNKDFYTVQTVYYIP